MHQRIQGEKTITVLTKILGRTVFNIDNKNCKHWSIVSVQEGNANELSKLSCPNCQEFSSTPAKEEVS